MKNNIYRDGLAVVPDSSMTIKCVSGRFDLESIACISKLNPLWVDLTDVAAT